MKKIILLAISLVLLLTLALGLTSCGKGLNIWPFNKKPSVQPETPVEKVVTVELNSQNEKLCVGGSITLTAEVENTSAGVVWSSSKTAVATVDGGVVTAVGTGTSVITASVDGKSAECVVTVTDAVAIIKPSVESVVLGWGQSYELSLRTFLEGEELSNVAYSWRVHGDSVLTTYSAAKDVATLRGIKVGEAVLTACANVGGVNFYTNIPVNVVDALTSFIVEGNGVVGNGANSYIVNLDIDETSSPAITLIESDQAVGGISLVWTSGNDSIATVTDDGNITAVANGTTNISCLVDGTYKLYFTVNVSRPVIEMDTVYTVETYIGSLTLTDELKGSISSVTLNGVEVLSSADGNSVVLDKTKLLFELRQLGEGRKMTVITDKVEYHYNVNIYTKVITTALEFKNLASYMNKSIGSEGLNQYTGYVILGNDIDLSATPAFSMFHRENSQAMGNGDCCFNGLLDGKGHSIKGYKSNGSGLFNTVGASGVVRNIAFTDIVVAPANANFIMTERFAGRFEDIYMSIKQWESGTIFHNWYAAGQSMANVVVHYTGGRIDGIRNLNGTNGHLMQSNVYIIGDISTVDTHCGGTSVTHASCIGVFKSIAELYSAELDLSSFRADIWNTDFGIPTIDSVASENRNDSFNILNSDSFVARGSTVKLLADGTYVVWSLSEPIEGVTLSGNVLTVSSNAPLGEITLVASNVFNPDEAKTITLNCISLSDEHTLPIDYLEVGDITANPELIVDISAAGAVDDVASVKVNGTELAYSFDGGVLKISKSGLRPYLSNTVSLTVLAMKDDGYVTINAESMVVTKAISTADEFINMAEYMDKSRGSEGFDRYTGYLVLANDIDLSGYGSFTLFYLSSSQAGSKDCGFDGTLDGQGFAVKNYTAGEGLFRVIGNSGVIKNIAFLDVVAPAGTAYIFCERANPFFYDSVGILQNIYISIKTWESGELFGHPFAAGQNLQNVIVHYTGEAIDGERSFFGGSNGHTTRQHIYFIGDVATLHTNCDIYSGHAEGSCVKTYVSIAEFTADTEKDMSSFTGSVWERSDVPAIK